MQPTIETARKLAQGYSAVPIYKVLPETARDPLELFRVLKKLSRHCYLFESLEDPGQWGRYTFLGYDPTVELTCTDGLLRINNGSSIALETRDPGRYIEQLLADYASPQLPELPPFTGGLVGYFSYDYCKYGEPLLDIDSNDQEGFKDVDLMLFDKVIAYDHREHRLFLIATVRTDALDENYHKALHELDALARVVQDGEAQDVEPLKLLGGFEPLFTEDTYCAMIKRAKTYIHDGDIFQVVLSNRLVAPAQGSLFDTYRALRDSNPSPYMFYFSSDDVEIAGASPETLAKLVDGQAFTFPLAGTRPRGATPAEDAALEHDLLTDAKELAEHNMLVDLGRNDVGKVSRFGTVEVERYLDILRFSHVMHIGSTVSGRIAADKTALDVIDAILPAGTLSGAPKLRACQIIHELEGNKRGIYGGAIGYLGFNGNMDTCIAIRLAFKKNGKIFVRSGAGIVADSVPANEYAECRNKIQAVINALHAAEGGYEVSAS
ncbi:MAG: anthranilate synthase component I family protein [Coriobacteriales bacterium]|jgi:anthranilate synthase component 1|nr:anthranilate synthase component I family protein [Coriobacteriales bacterium]